jgi:Icc-related predicted phosphoesterase
VIRVAAVGDLHAGIDSKGLLRPGFERVADRADLLLLAGDLTRGGGPDEAAVLAEELRDIPIPRIAVLGNHDYQADREADVRRILEKAGVQVLEGESTTLEVGDVRVGIAGSKGFGGGFTGACATDFGEPEMKAFVRHTKRLAAQLEAALRSLDGVDVKIALMHYAPVEATLGSEPLEIYPFLGSYLLAEAVDHGGAQLVFHGHAHRGVEKGVTPGGVPVRNVAQPVIKHAYYVYSLNGKPALSATA